MIDIDDIETSPDDIDLDTETNPDHYPYGIDESDTMAEFNEWD